MEIREISKAKLAKFGKAKAVSKPKPKPKPKPKAKKKSKDKASMLSKAIKSVKGKKG